MKNDKRSGSRSERGVTAIGLILLIVVGLAAAAAVILLPLFLYNYIFAWPEPLMADSRRLVTTCEQLKSQLDALPISGTTTRTLTPNDNRDLVTAPSLELPSGTEIQMAGNLTLAADGDLTIEGNIDFPDRRRVGHLLDFRLVLYSKNGTVRIGYDAEITGGVAADGASASDGSNWARASGAPGNNGGNIFIIGSAIEIEGLVLGANGGAGGGATAYGRDTVLSGSAGAAGGQGGRGGDIVICALEGVRLGPDAAIAAGPGGAGGKAVAQAANGGDAVARASESNIGGDVVFRGLGVDPMPVMIESLPAPGRFRGSVRGGNGSEGGQADADGGAGRGVLAGGGSGTANGGIGGMGGTVRFDNAVVQSPLTPAFLALAVVSGRGGRGGNGSAIGGDGGDAIALSGSDGGDATAIAGNGGPPGEVPLIRIVLPGAPGIQEIDGGVGTAGSGGDVFIPADPGDGGAPGGAPFTSGGDSGLSTARGGDNGLGQPPTPPPVPAIGPIVVGTSTAGGISAGVSQNGAR